MKRLLVVVFLLSSACATNQPGVTNEASDAPSQIEQSEKNTEEQVVTSAEQPAGEVASQAGPSVAGVIQKPHARWECSVSLTAPRVIKHLHLDEMGPTGSFTALPREHGVLMSGDGERVAYICATASGDSDECEGSLVEVVEFAEVVDGKLNVVWRSEPLLGAGNPACGRTSGNVVLALSMDDYDGDGEPDVAFGVTDPKQPWASVHTSVGEVYRASLPEKLPEGFDLCRPRAGLVVSGVEGAEVPLKVRTALEDAYVKVAECPDAE